MLSLSPAKILVVLVVALVVLGPDKLPGLARQLGSLWGDLRRLREKLEGEVRGVFPDLPPAHEITQVVRSPLSFLDRLADEHERSRHNGESGGSSAEDGNQAANGKAAGNGARSVAEPGEPTESPAAAHRQLQSGPDDPNMN